MFVTCLVSKKNNSFSGIKILNLFLLCVFSLFLCVYRPTLPDADVEADSFDIPNGQALLSRLQWEDFPDVSPTDSASSKASKEMSTPSIKPKPEDLGFINKCICFSHRHQSFRFQEAQKEEEVGSEFEQWRRRSKYDWSQQQQLSE